MVLSGGRFVEEGSHDQLISLGGLYAGLYRLQYDEAG
jgi:ABC-type multidrug transport system fused ATPase/permease subunit